ncbi:MAG: maleylpyruvate isomerase family mycothiol-dependent enzyme, partial [Jatrophihabitantaceae bacterium]
MRTNGWAELLDADRRAVGETVRLVSALTPRDLARHTPCDGWTVYDLVGHMTGQQLGFAAAARGAGQDRGDWAPSSAPYAPACADVLDAFAGDGVRERGFALAEIRAGGVFPAPIAVSFHLVDNVVHAWDLAVSIAAA